MSSTLKLQVVTPPTPLTSSGSLTSNAGVLAGTFDNTSVLAPVVDIGLTATFTTTPTGGQVIAVYMVPYVNSTTATTVDDSTPVFPSGSFVGNLIVTTTGSTQYLALQGIQLSALKYDVYLYNRSTGLTSWTLTFNPTDWQSS